MSDPYDVVSQYCLDHNKDFPVRNHAYAIYTQKLKDSIDDYKNKYNGEITPAAEKAIRQSHISEHEVRGYVAEAERIVSFMKEDAIRPYLTRFSWRDFWIAVAASAVGAFVFSVLLLGLIYLAQEQVRSWILPATSTSEQIGNREQLKK